MLTHAKHFNLACAYIAQLSLSCPKDELVRVDSSISELSPCVDLSLRCGVSWPTTQLTCSPQSAFQMSALLSSDCTLSLPHAIYQMQQKQIVARYTTFKLVD